MNSDNEILSPLSAEALEKFRVDKVVKPKTRGVCACGHSMSHHYHSESDGTWSCSPGKTYCACSKGKPVIVADNLRLFMYTTTGVGTEHALGKGILASIQSGAGFKWVNGHASCEVCGVATDLPIPVSVQMMKNAVGETVPELASYSAPVNTVVCADCFNRTWPR